MKRCEEVERRESGRGDGTKRRVIDDCDIDVKLSTQECEKKIIYNS